MVDGPPLWLGALFLAGCNSFGPLPSGFALPELDTAPWSASGTVTIESPWLSGQFRAAIAVVPGPEPRVRLQLFPELGGKVLDLTATAAGVAGSFPHTGEEYIADFGAGVRPYHPLLFMGLTLTEM